MWVLQLIDMRNTSFQQVVNVARADDAQKLQQWVKLERVPSYKDGQWYKVFRKGGPLEWYNPSDFGSIAHVGTEEDWVNRAKEEYKSKIESVYLVE